MSRSMINVKKSFGMVVAMRKEDSAAAADNYIVGVLTYVNRLF